MMRERVTRKTLLQEREQWKGYNPYIKGGRTTRVAHDLMVVPPVGDVIPQLFFSLFGHVFVSFLFVVFVFYLRQKVGFFLLLRTPPYITLPIFILITHRVYFVVFLTAVKYRRLKVCINFISSYFMGNIDGPFLSGDHVSYIP